MTLKNTESSHFICDEKSKNWTGPAFLQDPGTCTLNAPNYRRALAGLKMPVDGQNHCHSEVQHEFATVTRGTKSVTTSLFCHHLRKQSHSHNNITHKYHLSAVLFLFTCIEKKCIKRMQKSQWQVAKRSEALKLRFWTYAVSYPQFQSIFS